MNAFQFHLPTRILFGSDTIAQVGAEEGYISQDDVARLLKFRDNPSDESWIHGGKD